MLRLVILPTIAFLVMSQRYPSIQVDEESYTVDEAAEKLYKAMKGWGTDEDALIDVLTHQSYNRRLEIAARYQDKYGDSLWDDIESDTSGDFKGSLKPLVMTQAEYFASTMYYAMKGAGTDESALVNTLMLALLNDPVVLAGINGYFRDLGEKDLVDKIAEDTDDEHTFRDFLIAIVNRKDLRDDVLNETKVEEDYEVVRTYVANNNINSLIHLLTSRSLPHVKAITETYFQKEREELVEDIKEITGHHTREIFISYLAVAVDDTQYLASELYSSMKGRGTDEDLLTMIICTRADIDLGRIKFRYREITDNELKNDVKDDTSGDYRKVLLSLIN